MSGREWKPGDVALLATEGGERIGFRCGVESNMGWQYAREPGQNTWSADTSGYVAPIRPLVVIDIEDTDVLVGLAQYLNGAARGRGLSWVEVQAALRSLLAPPKPEEPTGLGAVVEDDRGGLWVRRRRDRPWCHADGGTFPCSWDDIDAVRVLSEGVQP